MDTETSDSNLKTVKELVLDEQKLVTYISLSKELCIHVNEAKSLLNHFVQDVRQNQPKVKIYVCYLISGLLNDNSACTTVCCEADAEEFKKTLKAKFFEHVYCVSRGMQTVDNVALTAINKFEDFPLCTGLIKANSCTKRSDEEIDNLKTTKKNIIIESNTNNAIKKKSLEKPKETIKNGHIDVKKPQEVKSEPVLKSKTPSPKKDISSSSIKKNGTKPVSKGIAGFFSKTNGDTNKNKTVNVKHEKSDIVKKEKDVEKPVEKEKEVNNSVQKKVIVKSEPKIDKDDSDTTEKAESTKKSKKISNGSLKQIKKNAKVDKKRKRVLHVSDSESENETNDPFADEDNKMEIDQESEDEIPPTPSANTVKITSGIVNPKKRRKIVDKTYTDEEGYILTKKVEVYESCSDNDEENKNVNNIEPVKENKVQVIQIKTETSPKENVKAKKKKVSPPQKGKQQMLTNFFKKV